MNEVIPKTCDNCGEQSTNPGSFLTNGEWTCSNQCYKEREKTAHTRQIIDVKKLVDEQLNELRAQKRWEICVEIYGTFLHHREPYLAAREVIRAADILIEELDKRNSIP